DHNSAMSTQMTERFSAPGATLVKLFGRPDEEAEEAVSAAPGRSKRWVCDGVVKSLNQKSPGNP
ncbi:hypothetical protein E3O53_09810, partial [Cryobacterium sp. TMT2-18-3]